jgi:uncharacterized protein
LKLSEAVKIVENKKIPSRATLIFGFPDVGLVGIIAGSHLVDELKLEEVAHVDSSLLPPLVVLHNGLPHSSIRIFGDGNLLIVLSEAPVPAEVIYPIMDALIEWGRTKNVKLMISLGGIPIQDRQDAKELKAFAAASSPAALKIAEDKQIEILTEGYMVGTQAIMLQRGAINGIPSITLLAQCFYNYPDPEAAAEVLKQLGKITGVKMDIAKLLEKGEEIRLRARDVMKRTQEEMSKMKKPQEMDIPIYVS